MIPYPIQPLSELAVVITRPATQAIPLCARIEALGGEAIAFPAVVIEPVTITTLTQSFDYLVFTSSNAVLHGLGHLTPSPTTQVVAIGNATANALANANLPATLIAPPPHTSEALLTAPAFADVKGKRILIVRGTDGRNVLRDTLIERGANVDYLEAYRRVPAQPPQSERDTLEARWQNNEVNVVTLTSVDILENLIALLSDTGCTLLQHTPFVAVSDRVATAARMQGLVGTCILAPSADDDSIVGAIAQWHARAKTATS